MQNTYYINEGHELSHEELVSYIIWKVKDLVYNKYTDDEILNFDENEIWKKYCKIILSKSINKH